jgi:hypothetical protein
MPPYKVLVDDNFHYMEEDARRELGTFPTLDAAVAACRKLVDEALLDEYEPAITAAELYRKYLSFGDDPFIVAPANTTTDVLFSAHRYAQGRAEALSAAGLTGWFRRYRVRSRMRRSLRTGRHFIIPYEAEGEE